MFGSGVLKGLGVTLRQFVATYIDDFKQIPSRYAGGRKLLDQTEVPPEGLFTVQYPEERRKVAERFRYIPMLIYEADTGEDRCTACGICAKVCPPQCIWIVRDKDEKGKPITRPAEFYIDTTICMNCGLCAEFCPFDAIKMNHDYEIAAYDRMPELIFDLRELRVPTTYYASIRPTDWAEEEAARKEKEAEKAAAKPAARPAEKPVAAAAAPVAAAPAAPAETAAPVKRSPEEIERLKAEAAARRAAKAAGETPVAAVPESVAPAEAAAPSVGAKRTPEEIERLKAEAAARRAAKAAGEMPAAAAPETVTPAPPPAVEPPAAPTAGTGAKRTPEEIERLKAEAAARRAAKAGQSGEQK